MRALFVADIHLNADQPQVVQRFLDFLGGPATEVDALYVLGDLFEAWLGDDFIPPGYQPIMDAFTRLTEAGVALHFMHGNRDFLLGERFAELTGGTLLNEGAVIEVDGEKILLHHGDALCIDDIPYQEMRKKLRSPTWKKAFLAKSPEERIEMARQLREKSREEIGSKDEGIMDVNPGAVVEAMSEAGTPTLIHGHTHRPANHIVALASGEGRRLVVGDWSEEGAEIVACIDGACELAHYP